MADFIRQAMNDGVLSDNLPPELDPYKWLEEDFPPQGAPTPKPQVSPGTWTGAIEDALDPLGLFHTSELDVPAPGQPATPPGAVQQAAATIAGGVSSGLKWGIILAVGYLIVRSELSRK